jgi:hypothetical protein
MVKGKAAQLKPGEVLPVPVHCSGSGCHEETALLLPGKLPYKQGVWLEDGWQVFNHLENRSILFVCSSCREKGERSSQLAHKKVEVTLRD